MVSKICSFIVVEVWCY